MKLLSVLLLTLTCLFVGCRYGGGGCPGGNCVEKTTVEQVKKEVANGDEFVVLFIKPVRGEVIRAVDKARVLKIVKEKYGNRLYVIYASSPSGAVLARQAEVKRFPAIVIVTKENGDFKVVRKIEGVSKVEEVEEFLYGAE